MFALSYRVHSKGSYGLRKVQRVHNLRSNRAKRIDESLRAPIAKSAEQWLAQPNRFDFPDVDTPQKTDDDLETQLKRFEANRMRSSHRAFRQRLNVHKYSGTTR
jgi:hypothetical protein